ncbi:hypothetical protein AMAG_19571 [Allomyces macrogynus ATCC 38327]|uniref:DNA ligase ATP-dependent N-terminal domain-containing protein n=1 Tax=Allomyces macrogynus (strain ATCC 38327) TaxID=578462 RepID=A0A0L0SV30_ALLM3|nr:hypothetical protein AMAG_19571 [Allomyces macrogynus ATCC 38327]|eukprot:KNE66372.1 hypothetical protein AMAG_19571 [Allomyces macrogynus ATCC 38327]
MAYLAHNARAAPEAAVPLQPLRWSQFTDFLDKAHESAQDVTHKVSRGLLDRVHARRDPVEASAVLRLLLPAHDRARGVYKLKEAALAKCIKDALHLLEAGNDNRTLKNWRAPRAGHGLFTTSSDLHAVATRLIDRAASLTAHDEALQAMVPFCPILGFKGDRLNLLPEKLARFQSPIWCQEKVDGERIIIYYRDGESKFYTRNAVDWKSYSFGTLRAAQQSDAMDAGTLATHPWAGRCSTAPLPTGLSLRQFFHPRVGWFEILPVVECTTPNDVLVQLKAIYESKGEGLVVDPTSMRVVERREAKRGNRFSHFLLGLWNPGAGRNGEDTWVSFASVGSGYTIQQLDDLHAAICDEYPNLANGNTAAMAPGPSALTVPVNLPPPPWADDMGNSKERPGVYIFPVRGMALGVIAAEPAAAEDFKAGAASRFPHVRRIRKDPAEAMS